MREEDVLQVLGGSFFNSVLVDIEKNTYTRMNFAPWLLKISQTGMYTGLADFIVCNSAVEEYKESLKKDLSLESIEIFFNSRDPEERDEENSITYPIRNRHRSRCICWYFYLKIQISTLIYFPIRTDLTVQTIIDSSTILQIGNYYRLNINMLHTRI